VGRNITLNLDEDVIQDARVLAARRGTSVSALLRAEIERLVREDRAYDAAREAALRRLKRGSHLGGGPLPPREELHDREDLR
jgi:hypothetical protein